MSARTTRGSDDAITTADVEGRLRTAGLSPRTWSNEPGYRYGWHEHDYHKILFCIRGAITFHTRHGDVPLEPGDRLDVEPATAHAATVHEDGVTCVEAVASGPQDLP